MGAFEYRQAKEIREVFARHGVRYLFIGRSGAIIPDYPDTTQDAMKYLPRSRTTEGSPLCQLSHQRSFAWSTGRHGEGFRPQTRHRIPRGPRC